MVTKIEYTYIIFKLGICVWAYVVGIYANIFLDQKNFFSHFHIYLWQDILVFNVCNNKVFIYIYIYININYAYKNI